VSEKQSASQQLDEAIKAAEIASQKVEELKKLTREEDLKNVITLISRHGFTQTDLKSVLKTRGTPAKKSTTTKRPYVRKKK
jgi:SOS response regulatory protein OraA/RecX